MIRRLSKDARGFKGRVFRRNRLSRWSSDRRYFKPSLADMKAGIRPLHVEVWRHYKGPVPAGYQIHHRKGTDRNRLRDLKLMLARAHRVVHTPADIDAVRARLARVRPLKGTVNYLRAQATRVRRRRSRRRRGARHAMAV